MQKLHKLFRPNVTAQNRPIDAAQLKNSAGGYVWELDPWQRLDRFLILGTEGGSFYASEQTLSVENAENVMQLLKEDGVRVLERVTELSTQGRAYKNDPALFVLALAFTVADAETRAAAQKALPEIARTGTHLFTFMEFVNSMRGWGRGLRRAVALWYDSKDLRDLAYQVSKYAQRNGWTHRDALRLAHPKTKDVQRDALYRYITGHGDKLTGVQAEFADYLNAVDAVKAETSVSTVVEAIRQYKLPREVLPTEMLTHAEVWEALFERMPMTAMIRNLATMTRVGLLTPMSDMAEAVAERVTDKERLRKARVHPIQLLAALMTYASGQGARGKGSWTPVQSVVDALDEAFYLSFETVVPADKRIMLALDVSSSMTWGQVAGVPGLSPRVASAALALVTAVTERQHMFTAFAHKFVPLDISPRQRLDDVLKLMNGMPFGGTDCALPMQYALKEGLELDAFVILTDSETWFGKQHPVQALAEYRQRMGIAAKLIVVGMLGNRFSIADPRDAGMLDVVGFSTDTPIIISDFIRGDLS
ncbi:MAG: TROVE domain-containing protein [Trueperaceae bacterium]|nr:TROVE domain-containing protein [Trueperaceae bacterium]